MPSAITLDQIKSDLADRAEELCTYLFGTPSKRTASELRWGRKGSMRLKLRGKNAPSFADFEAGRGGSMLEAIMVAEDIHRVADAVAWAKDWLGMPATERRKIEPRRNDTPDPDLEGERHARAIWDASGSLPGTPGELYLQRRGILPDHWPASVRWNKAGFLVFASTAPDGRHTAVQRVYIDHAGRAVTDEDGKGGRTKRKRTRGPRYGGAVHFRGNARPDVLVLAEGPETALSIWHATGMETWATIGPTHTVNLEAVPIDRTILVALDDDGRVAQVAKHTRHAIERWRGEGRTVLTVLPWGSTRRDKSDFNDTLQEQGPEGVRARIDAALTPAVETVELLPIDEARDRTAEATEAALDMLLSGEGAPSAAALKIGTGIGKTEAALRAVIARLVDGEIKSATVAVPNNALSAELIRRAETIVAELGGKFRAGSWRGRDAENPEAHAETMCRRSEAARAAGRAGLDVQTFVCKTPEGSACPFFDGCAYQRQRGQRPRLTITTHATIFADKPKGVPAPSVLVIDESFWSTGVIGADRPILTPVDELQGAVRITHEHGRDLFGNYQVAREASTAADLEPVRLRLREILETTPVGPLRREHIEAVGLTGDQCRAAVSAEYARLATPRIAPNMDEAEILRRLEAVADNAGCLRRAALFGSIAAFIDKGAEASGHVLIDRTEDGRPAFRSLGRRPIGKGWHAPTLILDATLRTSLVRPFFPDVQVVAEIEAEAPHQRIVQHYSRSFAKSHFRDRKATGPWSADTKAVGRLWTWCRAEVQKTDGRALMVAQKAVEDAIRGAHKALDRIELAHHNAVAGRDGWRDVRTLICVGRTLPSPDAVERLAMALTGEWIDPAMLPTEKNGRWYAGAAVTKADRTGKAVSLMHEHHIDATAEAVRASICDDELVQIIGRARGVNRKEGEPVEIHILADLPLPVQVDEFKAWEPPSLDAAMLAEGCWTESAKDAALFWPEIVKNDKALKDARHSQSVEFSYNSLIYQNSTHWTCLTYQKPGPRQRPVEAVFDTRLIPDPEAWLVERLGPVNVVILDAAEAPAPRKACRKADRTAQKPLPVVADEPPPASPPPEPWTHGTLPDAVVSLAKARMRATNARHEDAARAIGISRQQWTNALNRRFGLSTDAANRLLRWLTAPPDGPIQPNLQL